MTVHEDQDRYEMYVLDKARHAIRAFCVEWRRAKRVPDRREPLTPFVVTVRATRDVNEIDQALAQFASRVLRRRVHGLYRGTAYPIVESTDPWFVHVQVTVDGSGVGTDDQVAPGFVPPPAPRTSAEGCVMIWTHRGTRIVHENIEATEHWRLTGREMRPAQQRWPAVVIDELATVVPREALLELRFFEGQLSMRRGPDRPEYTVRVDGLALTAQTEVVCGETGTIEYVFGLAEIHAIHYEIRTGSVT